MKRQIISAVKVSVLADSNTGRAIIGETIGPEIEDFAGLNPYTNIFGFGKYTSLAQIGEEYFLIQEEPWSFQCARNPCIFIANTIAGMLGHGCAVSDEEAASAPSLRVLQAMWNVEGMTYNDNLGRDEGWMSGMTGWQPTRDERGQIIELTHSTQSGRMFIKLEQDNITVEIWAGPAPESESNAGRRVIWFKTTGYYEDSGRLNMLIDGNPALMEGRPDRLSLFWDFDLRLGGVITEELERMSTKPGYYGWAISKALLAAKAEGELKSKVRHICTEAVRYTAEFLGNVEPGFEVNAAVLAAALSERFGYKFAVENNPNAYDDTEINPDWLNCWLKGKQLEDGFVLGVPRIGTLI